MSDKFFMPRFCTAQRCAAKLVRARSTAYVPQHPGGVGEGGAPVSERNQSASLRRALAILGHIRDSAGAGRGVSLAQLAADLGMAKSTVLRLGAPLIDAGLVARDQETGWFRLGHGSLQLGQAYLYTLDLRTLAGEEARRVQREAGETVHLVVYDAPHVVYVDKVENEANLRMGSRIGTRAPAYRTAVGKAILAWLPEDAVDAAVRAGLPRVTPHTITDGAVFRAELARVRERGYAVDDRENEPEVRCVGAPIFDHDDAVTAAMSVSALSSRMTPARVRLLGPRLAQSCLRISRALGARR
jgi:DNA-binding IclR family transcriptional regulator